MRLGPHLHTPIPPDDASTQSSKDKHTQIIPQRL